MDSGERSVRASFPAAVDLWRRGEFPVERMMATYDFDEIERAAHDAESGVARKPVLRMA